MRRIVMFNRVTADGFFADENGGLDWAVPEPTMDAEVAKGLGDHPEGAMLFGRRTYEMFAAFWPRAIDASETSPDPHAARRTKELRAMAVWINAAKKWVVSRSTKDAKWTGTEIVRDVEPKTIEAIKSTPGNDVMIFGSGSIVAQLTDRGLIDEYRLVVSPLFLGKGRNMLGELQKSARLELVEAKAYPAGNVLLRYVRTR